MTMPVTYWRFWTVGNFLIFVEWCLWTIITISERCYRQRCWTLRFLLLFILWLSWLQFRPFYKANNMFTWPALSLLWTEQNRSFNKQTCSWTTITSANIYELDMKNYKYNTYKYGRHNNLYTSKIYHSSNTKHRFKLSSRDWLRINWWQSHWTVIITRFYIMWIRLQRSWGHGSWFFHGLTSLDRVSDLTC